MKYALMRYESFNGDFNIGDYIQSIAAEQYLPKIDFLISRERLDCYTGENAKLIMNGWFMHEAKHWPPAKSIIPLFVSFHLNSEAYPLLQDKKSVEYFKQYEPIGCRDYDTVSILEKYGIKAYFTGCLTLTIGNIYNNSTDERKGVYFVDPYFEFKKDFFSVYKYIIVLLRYWKNINTISKKKYNNKYIKNLIKSAAFYMQYGKFFDEKVLVNAVYKRHILKDSLFKNDFEKLEYAKSLLKKYSSAKLVVTSRIHCALPSIGMNTPVVYIDNAKKSISSACRLKGLIDYLNIVKYDDGVLEPINFIAKKITEDFVVPNKGMYKEKKKKLTELCFSFVG